MKAEQRACMQHADEMAKRQAESAVHFQTEMDNLRAEHAMEIKNMKAAMSEVSSIGGKVIC